MYERIEFWAVILLIAGILYILRKKYKNKKYFENMVDEIMDGKPLKKSYHDVDYARISRYFKEKSKKEEGFIDDITWNDLDMNSIFEKVNNAISGMGEGVLYNMLRYPLLNLDSVKTRKKHINMIDDDGLLRRKILGKLVRLKAGSGSNLLKILFEDTPASFPSVGLTITLSISLLFCIVLAAINMTAGFFPAFILFIVNMTMHFKNLKDMKIVCTSVGEGTKLVDGYKGLRKEIKDILGELPAVDSKIFAVTSGPLSFLQGIPDIITEVIRMVFLLDLLFYSKKFKVIKQYKQDILEVYKVIGYFDAINSIIMYRNRLKYYSEPYFSDNKKINYKCTSMYHPLLTEPVSNSVDLKKSVILTGSNASGKSTFLKTAAINTILSQSLLTSLSKKYEAGFYIVITSIALNDSIKDGESYFIAEIKSLKRVLGKLNKEIPVLCIVDEILRGTNTTERISASAQVLLSFAKNNSLTIAATHDHELCTILSKHFDNYHFEEKIEDNNVTFDYLMKKGPSESKNAIKLLEIYEYGSNIIKESNRMYTDFLKTGKWEIL